MDANENLNLVFAFISVHSRLKIHRSKIIASYSSKRWWRSPRSLAFDVQFLKTSSMSFIEKRSFLLLENSKTCHRLIAFSSLRFIKRKDWSALSFLIDAHGESQLIRLLLLTPKPPLLMNSGHAWWKCKACSSEFSRRGGFRVGVFIRYQPQLSSATERRKIG